MGNKVQEKNVTIKLAALYASDDGMETNPRSRIYKWTGSGGTIRKKERERVSTSERQICLMNDGDGGEKSREAKDGRDYMRQGGDRERRGGKAESSAKPILSQEDKGM